MFIDKFSYISKGQTYTMFFGKFKGKNISINSAVSNTGKTLDKIFVIRDKGDTKIVTKIRNLTTDKFERINKQCLLDLPPHV